MELQTYLTTEGLAERIHYDTRTIRERMKDSVLLEPTADDLARACCGADAAQKPSSTHTSCHKHHFFKGLYDTYS
jgi:hypothetical protein